MKISRRTFLPGLGGFGAAAGAGYMPDGFGMTQSALPMWANTSR